MSAPAVHVSDRVHPAVCTGQTPNYIERLWLISNFLLTDIASKASVRTRVIESKLIERDNTFKFLELSEAYNRAGIDFVKKACVVRTNQSTKTRQVRLCLDTLAQSFLFLPPMARIAHARREQQSSGLRVRK